MIVKFAGICLVMGASILWGFSMGSKDKRRMRDLAELKSAFMTLKSEINFGLSQLGEAMENAGTKVNKPVNDIFMNFSREIAKTKENPYEVWIKALEAVNNTGFSEEDLNMFKKFGRVLGFLDKNMQINNIDTQIFYIDEKLDRLSKSSPKNFKLYNSLGLLGGMLIVIILI